VGILNEVVTDGAESADIQSDVPVPSLARLSNSNPRGRYGEESQEGEES
jgi:hypothetical protein